MQNEKSDEPVRLLKTVFLQNGKYYELQVATSMVEEDDLVKQLFYSVLWLYLGLVVTIIVFNNFLLKKIWRPFYQLLRNVKGFRIDKPRPLLPVETKIDEFRLLHETIDKLLLQNIEIYRGQKHLIENAAHELQTPLAVSIGKLEMLAENNTLPEDQLKLLASALDNLERMTRLNKSLLLLSRIENKQFPDERVINLNTIIKKIVADFADQSEFTNVSVTIEEKEINKQNMNEDLALILITNLVKNAIIHNRPDGRVHIVIDKHAIIIRNSAKTGPLDPNKIFSRFHSAESSKASTGLGLAIVKAIADLYRFQVTYSYNQDHEFNIRFTA